jgi:aminoglycoside phosphotransferase (APT) family kinase protein
LNQVRIVNALNKAQSVRTEDQLDLVRLSEYLIEHLDGFGFGDELELKQFSGGASNLTYQLSWKDQKLILRTAPRGVTVKSAHDMSREFKVLKKLEASFKYAPKPILLCEEPRVIGRNFYLMEKIDGYIPRKEFPFESSPEIARKICEELIDVHVQMHEIDIEATGLISIGDPVGYIRRQVDGWNNRYIAAKTNNSLAATGLMNWLEANIPDDVTHSLIHNDYKLDNVVLSEQNPTKIIAVLDWEMTTVGSPLMDLGCSLAYWIEKNDPAELQAIRMMPTHLDGMMTRDEIVAYYANKRNMKIEDFNYYYVFGLFRLAVIVQQIYKRFDLGKTSNPAFAGFGQIANILINQATSKI